MAEDGGVRGESHGSARCGGRHRAWRILCLASAVVGLQLLLGCGEKKVAVPDVVGVTLDAARSALTGAGFDKLKEKDAFEDRVVADPTAWAVVAQSTVAGSMRSVSTEITLSVGKVDESRTIDRLPLRSPVVLKAREGERVKREDEAQRAEQALQGAAAKSAEAQKTQTEAEGRAAAGVYVNQIDETVRFGNKTLVELRGFGRAFAQREPGDVDRLYVDGSLAGIDLYLGVLKVSPPGAPADLGGQHQALLDAVGLFRVAAETLKTASGASRKDTVGKFDSAYAEARAGYNGALTQSYERAGLAAPLLAA